MKPYLIALIGCAVAAPAAGNIVPVTYTVQGAFADGGTFSGTFGYDPIANAYVDAINAVPPAILYGQFDVTTGIGTQGLANIYNTPGPPSSGGYDDGGSTPRELSITGGGGAFQFWNLVLNWNNALNSPGGGAQQLITGGSETFTTNCLSNCVTTQRQVVSGFVVEGTSLAPVPLPAAAWLMLSGLGGLGALARRKRATVGRRFPSAAPCTQPASPGHPHCP